MTKVLSDGTVITSNLSTGNQLKASDLYRKDMAFKSGTVVAMYYPEDPKSLSKAYIEYDVQVVESRHDGSSSTVTYTRCQVLDMFGASNNFSHFTLQPATKNDDGFYENGAKVTILSLNSNPTAGNAVIVGGLPYSYTVSADNGQFWGWQFNGVNQLVNKDGEYILTFNTPIDQDGNKADDKAAGTVIKIAKDGSLKISDNEGQFWSIDRVNKVSSWGNGNEIITIDKANKSVSITSTGKMTETVQDSKTENITNDYTQATSSGSINQNSGSNITQNAQGNITQKAGGSMQVQSGGGYNVQSGGAAMIQAGGALQLQGTTVSVGAGGVQAAGVGISQAFGTNGGGPMMSTILTGSSTVLIGT